MKWDDIDYEKRTANVYDSVVVVKDRNKNKNPDAPKYKVLEQGSTKTETSKREVQLTKSAIASLQEIQKLNGKHKHVMATSSGKISTPRNFDRMLRSILQRCGIKPAGAHALRHTFASLLFKKGSIKTKNRSGRFYYYLQYRKGDKVIT